ncbi:hypothetical protein GIB67_020471 [Kingdonia uniflora]|uniref:Chalcone synthase n=1 Tax=Kingdonia uniflora TaxID=39325 RepID=A0A7J7LUX8_9MAGN|nr:hypothetical protein GIB67_020471 [Kingdonia uniflora]
MVFVEEIHKAQRTEAPTTLLAIGTTTPFNCVFQADFPDYYFRIIKNNHLIELREKFKCIYAQQDMIIAEVQRLGKEAATKAIKGLFGYPNISYFFAYVSQKPSRCYEITMVTFCEPSHTTLDSLVGQALFDDGAVAVIIGADHDMSVKHPLFKLVSADQIILADSEGAIEGHIREVGLTFHLLKGIPRLISKNIEKCLTKASTLIRIKDWNLLFWIAHPGGPTILEHIELKLRLKEEKL